jgi:hypothetical protein
MDNVAANMAAPAPPQSSKGLRCREIEERDMEDIVALLAKGFTARSRKYWARALHRLSHHPTPPGLPKLGYLLEYAGKPVGVLLLICSHVATAADAGIRCNVSSWYVEPAFRSFASLLVLRSLKHNHVTYLNISPAPHTRATIEAQGFSRYCNGQLLALPMLSRQSAELSIEPIGSVPRPDDPAAAAEFDLLKAHADLGCISLWCRSDDRVYPFAFLPRRVAKGFIPVAQLVYCREHHDFVRFARPLGRYLAARGRPLVLLDATGPIAGLPGRYFAGNGPKYFKGPNPPRLGDLAFIESVLFGP